MAETLNDERPNAVAEIPLLDGRHRARRRTLRQRAERIGAGLGLGQFVERVRTRRRLTNAGCPRYKRSSHGAAFRSKLSRSALAATGSLPPPPCDLGRIAR